MSDVDAALDLPSLNVMLRSVFVTFFDGEVRYVCCYKQLHSNFPSK